MVRKISSVWKFFKKTDVVHQRAQCRICGNKYSYRSTTANLITHLKVRHKGAHMRFLRETESNTSTRSSRSEVPHTPDASTKNQKLLDLRLWNYFERDNFFDETARCNLCQDVLSYKTSTASLKIHLQMKHAEEYSDYLQDLKPHGDESGDASPRSPVTYTILAEGPGGNESSSQLGQEDDLNYSKKFCEEVWEQFELRDSAAHCIICEKSIENTIESMKGHLEDEHPLVLTDILKRDTADSTDAESVHNEETDLFTEVVYLENLKPGKSLKRKRATPKRTEDTSSNVSSETQREISSFLNYISVMLLKVHKKSLSKLQVDIINMISKKTEDGI